MTDDERPSAKNLERLETLKELSADLEEMDWKTLPQTTNAASVIIKGEEKKALVNKWFDDWVKEMTDTEGEDCGISPLQIRGWPKLACRWHDSAYVEKSWHQGNMSRLEVDKAFLRQLLTLSGSNIGKRVLSYGMYYVARIFGARFWEGKK